MADEHTVGRPGITFPGERDGPLEQVDVSPTRCRVREGVDSLDVAALARTRSPREDMPQQSQNLAIGCVRVGGRLRNLEQVASCQTLRFVVVEESNALIKSVPRELGVPPVDSNALVLETMLEDVLRSSSETAPHVARQREVDWCEGWPIHDSHSSGARRCVAHAGDPRRVAAGWTYAREIVVNPMTQTTGCPSRNDNFPLTTTASPGEGCRICAQVVGKAMQRSRCPRH